SVRPGVPETRRSRAFLRSFGRFVFVDSCFHQRLQKFSRQLAPVWQLDETGTGLVARSLDRCLLAGEEGRIEAKGAVTLEVLQHPQIRVLATHVHRKIPFEFLSRLGVDLHTELPERLEMRSLDGVQLSEE